ncbi:MAG: class II aldolase/adducin family protein [Acidilobaceae archaeon]
MVEVMRAAYLRGLTQARGGNASILDESLGLVYITPRSAPKFLLTETSISLVSLDGRILWGSPSSELSLHLEVYRRVGEARAVLHLHPPMTLAVSELGLEIELEALSEASYAINCVARIPYIKPATRDLAEAVASVLEKTGCNTAVLEKHGVVAYSRRDLYEALDMIEALEDLSRIMLVRELSKKRLVR